MLKSPSISLGDKDIRAPIGLSATDQVHNVEHIEGPDGSYGCPYPTILDALENVQGGQSILVKEGRYTDLIFADFINQSTHLEGPKIEVIGESDNTYIDGTVEVNASWEPYNLNGNQVYRAVLDMGQISKNANTYIDTIYGVFVNVLITVLKKVSQFSIML